MKFLLMATVLSLSLFGGDWASYKTIYDNRSFNKPVFVFVSRDNCKYCSIERDRISKDKNFMYFLRKNFQTVYINESKDFTPVYLMSNMTPAFYVLEPKNLKIMVPEVYGAMPLSKMTLWLNKTLTIYKNKISGEE